MFGDRHKITELRDLVVVVVAQIRGIDRADEVGSATKIISIVDFLVRSGVVLNARHHGQMASSREPQCTDAIGINLPLISLVTDNSDRSLNIL